LNHGHLNNRNTFLNKGMCKNRFSC
jgi:hypothetical protein